MGAAALTAAAGRAQGVTKLGRPEEWLGAARDKEICKPHLTCLASVPYGEVPVGDAPPADTLRLADTIQ